MRRILILTAGLVLLVFLSGCSSEGEQNIYGIYTFEEVSYLSLLSSATKDYVNSQMEEQNILSRRIYSKLNLQTIP